MIRARAGEVACEIVLEPATQHFVDALSARGGPAIETLAPAAARAFLADAQAAPVGKPAARVEERVFPVGPTGEVRVLIVRPPDDEEPPPVVIYLHGGGWVRGDRKTHERLVHEIATGVPAAVVFVDYELAPEARYPVALEQAHAAARYVAEHGARLGVDPARMAIAGDGAGGNLAAAVALLAKQRRGPGIGFQLLFYPVTDAAFDTQSYRTFADGPWLTRAAMQWFWDAYLPDRAAREQITAAPLHASLDELRGLPDALVIVGENDVLRDEGEAYARKLTRAGARVTCARYLGTIHDFATLNALADTPAARAAIAQAICSLRTALE
jgi:acetyl esterase/lipase